MPFKQSKSKPKHSLQFEAIGTHWSIETVDALPVGAEQSVAEHIEQFDKTYSRFRDDSVVSVIAKDAGAFTLPDSSINLSKFYRQLYKATNGAMSPLVGKSLESAGYDKTYSLRATGPTVAPTWDNDVVWQGTSLTAKHPVMLDIGAAGKGLLVDEVADVLEKAGVRQYTIDASGDIKVRSAVQRVGLENPLDPTTVIGVAEVTDASLCASATNRRKWGDGWHHVLDARTGKPVNDVLATWVVAQSTMLADGLATALFFVPADKLTHITSFEYVRLLADGTVEYSKGFVGELYI